MKQISTIFMFLLALGVIHGQSDTQPIATGLPGDNFSLEGSLEMFQKATSPVAFCLTVKY